jgi:hypothetical protein
MDLQNMHHDNRNISRVTSKPCVMLKHSKQKRHERSHANAK